MIRVKTRKPDISGEQKRGTYEPEAKRRSSMSSACLDEDPTQVHIQKHVLPFKESMYTYRKVYDIKRTHAEHTYKCWSVVVQNLYTESLQC